MRARALTAALFLLPVVVPDTSSAVTIPLADSSTFTGTVDGELLGPSRTDGYPNGGSTGSISFYGVFGPGSIVQVTALNLSQDFTFGYACYGYYCPPSMQNVAVMLTLEEPGTVVIDGGGGLHVIVSAQGVEEAATLVLRTPRRTTGTRIFVPAVEDDWPSLRIEGTLQFDNPVSPFAGLQGVTLVPEPARAAAMLIAMTLVAAMLGLRKRTLRIFTR